MQLDHATHLLEDLVERRARRDELEDPGLLVRQRLALHRCFLCEALVGDVAADGLVLGDTSLVVEHDPVRPLVPADVSVSRLHPVHIGHDGVLRRQRSDHPQRELAVLLRDHVDESCPDELVDGPVVVAAHTPRSRT